MLDAAQRVSLYMSGSIILISSPASYCCENVFISVWFHYFYFIPVLDAAQRVSLYLSGSIIFISPLCSMLLRECLYIYLAPLFLFHPCARCCSENVFISIWLHYFYFIPCLMLLRECLYIYLVPLFLFHPYARCCSESVFISIWLHYFYFLTVLDAAQRESLYLSGSIIFISPLCSMLLRECLYIYLAPLFLFHPCARCCSKSVFISIWFHYFYFIPVLDAAQRVSLYLSGSIDVSEC